MPEGGLHVVFGTGQVGLALAGRLAEVPATLPQSPCGAIFIWTKH